MTRNEACVEFNEAADPASLSTGAWIDRFVALGMLHLDEPKSAAEQLSTALWSEGLGNIPAEKLEIAARKYGLKITEK